MNEVYHVLNMALWRIKAAVDSSKEDRREALAYVCVCIDAEFGAEGDEGSDRAETAGRKLVRTP